MRRMARPAVAVIGGGPWGVGLASAAARTGAPTILVSRRALGSLPGGVTLARDDSGLGARARVIILAVPSSVAPQVARSLGAQIDGRHYVVHGVRGLAPDGGSLGSLKTISDVVHDE